MWTVPNTPIGFDCSQCPSVWRKIQCEWSNGAERSHRKQQWGSSLAHHCAVRIVAPFKPRPRLCIATSATVCRKSMTSHTIRRGQCLRYVIILLPQPVEGFDNEAQSEQNQFQKHCGQSAFKKNVIWEEIWLESDSPAACKHLMNCSGAWGGFEAEGQILNGLDTALCADPESGNRRCVSDCICICMIMQALRGLHTHTHTHTGAQELLHSD